MKKKLKTREWRYPLDKMNTKQLYREIEFQPVPIEQCGRCPKCNTEKSKIVWGWHGVYYDLVCENGHLWTFKFKKAVQEKVK